MTKITATRFENPHPTEEMAVYVLDGITYLPHYRVQDMYVSPGYGNAGFGHQNLFTAAELMRAGAAQSKRSLWTR